MANSLGVTHPPMQYRLFPKVMAYRFRQNHKARRYNNGAARQIKIETDYSVKTLCLSPVKP